MSLWGRGWFIGAALALSLGPAELARAQDLPPTPPLRQELAKPLTPARIRARYANALRHFNKRVTQAQAETLAGVIMEESRENELDARVVVAVVAVEGLLNKVTGQGANLRLWGKPATATIGGLAKDLRAKITARSKQPASASKAVLLGITDRGAARSPKGAGNAAAAKKYATRVRDLYRQLSGMR